MNTREKIIEAARTLFNAQGMKPVTARKICQEVGISLGSFSYYFPDRSKIVTELYAAMLDEVVQLIQQIPDEELSIYHYLETHRQLFGIQLKYKFFYLNLFEILSTHPEVREIYQQHRNMEREMAFKSIELFMDQGILEDKIHIDQIDRLINIGQMLNNSWMIDAEISYGNDMPQKLAYYMKLCCGLLEPYLNEKERKVFKSYFDKLEGQHKIS